MSRTLLTSLLDRHEIPFRYVGSHRRVRLQDLLTFRAEQERRHQAMNELTTQAQELNMGY
jgi:predicted glycosyltransferase